MVLLLFRSIIAMSANDNIERLVLFWNVSEFSIVLEKPEKIFPDFTIVLLDCRQTNGHQSHTPYNVFHSNVAQPDGNEIH